MGLNAAKQPVFRRRDVDIMTGWRRGKGRADAEDEPRGWGVL